MNWLLELFTSTESVAHIALLYAVVIAAGVYLGKIKIGGISLGVTFVLFTGILFGHLGFTAPMNILTFIQDFGLILFVFMIGLQVGPGFFESFRKEGISLNILSTIAILLNILVMFVCYWTFFDTSNPANLPMMIGTMYGAVTNTPALGAANEALSSVFTSGNIPEIASGYACAYPLGVLGIIGATIIIRYICRINLNSEEQKLEEAELGHKVEILDKQSIINQRQKTRMPSHMSCTCEYPTRTLPDARWQRYTASSTATLCAHAYCTKERLAFQTQRQYLN